MNLLRIIMLFGAPYSGKSTHRRHKYTALQKSGYACQVVNIGGMLNERIAQAQKNNLFVCGLKNLKENGKLVPEEIPISLFFETLYSNKSYDVIITDGVGRRLPEMKKVLKVLYELIPEEKLQIDVVHLNISWDEMIIRFKKGKR